MKFLLKLLLITGGLFITVYLAIGFWLKTDAGEKMLTSLITNYLQQNLGKGYKLELERATFSFPSAITLQRLIISDHEKQFLMMENFSSTIAPSLLWPLKINIWSISTGKATLPEIPADVNINIRNKAAFYPLSQVVHFWSTLKTDTDNILINNGELELRGKLNTNRQTLEIMKFVATAKANAEENVITGNLNIDFLQNTVSGKAVYEKEFLTLEHVFTEDALILNDIRSEAEISGAINNPLIKITGKLLPKIRKRELPLIELQSEIITGAKGIKGKVSINIASLRANGQISQEDQGLFLKNFIIQGKNLTSNINLKINGKDQSLTIDADLDSTNIAELAAFWPGIYKGSAYIKVKYHESKHLSVEGRIRNLSTSNLACNLLEMDLLASNLNQPKIDHANIKIRFLSASNHLLKNFVLKTKNQSEFTSTLELLHPYTANLQIKGSINATDKTIDIISNIMGTIGKTDIASTEELKITLDKNTEKLVFSAPYIKTGNGVVSASYWSDKKDVKGKITMKDFPLSTIPYLLPSSGFSEGLVSGGITLDGRQNLPQVTSSLEITNINLRENNGTRLPFTIHSQIDLGNNLLTIDLGLFRQGKSFGRLLGNIPYHLSLSPFESSFLGKDIPLEKSISASLVLNQKSSILSLIPLPPGHRLRGYVVGHAKISGSMNNMLINGKISITDSEYQYQPYGIRLKNIEANIAANGQDIRITDLVAKDIHGNNIKGSGSISLNKKIPFGFQFATDKFELINTPYFQGQLAGHLDIAGNRDRGKAEGNFSLERVEIKIPERFSDDIPVINIIDPVQDQEKMLHMEAREREKKESYVLELDIGLAARKQVYVRGWGVNTLLVGDLKITGDPNDPHIFGKLVSNKGRYQEFGKVLTVREGVLEFNGPISPSPYLHIVGATMVGNTEIRLILAGSIFHPDITIASTPLLAQENALSLLLFGKNPDSISTIQALTLASSMRKLSGHGGGFDIAELGRKLIPLDDIRFNYDEDTKSSIIGIGKYLNDRVYVELEQGDEVAGTKTKIEVELTPKISLEGITSEREGSSVGINWYFDY